MSIGATSTTDQRLTADEFLLRSEPTDGSREELISGRIFTMPPPQGEHGYLSSLLCRILGNFVADHQLGWVLSESGVLTSRNPDSVRGPDIAYYSSKRFATYPTGYSVEPPDLVVEIISPNDRYSDVERKIWEYLKWGIPVVWSVDPKNKTVTVYKGLDRSQHLEISDIIKGGEQIPGFECPVSRLFDAGAA